MMSYAVLAGGPSTPPPCGDQAVLDPVTSLCHCFIEGQIRNPNAPNDCIDPYLLCTAENETWSEAAGGCVTVGAPPTPKATKVPAPRTSGVPVPVAAATRPSLATMAGYGAMVTMGGAALFLFGRYFAGGAGHV